MIKGVLITVGWLLGLVVGGSLLAWVLTGVLDYPYIKLLSRSLLLLTVLSLIPLWRFAGLSAESIGLKPLPDRQALQGLLRPFCWALALIAPLMLFHFVTGFRVVDSSVSPFSSGFAGEIAIIAVSAILVSVFEETLFRGVLFTSIYLRFGFVTAAAVSSLLYGWVHFLNPGDIVVTDPGPFSGFVHIADALAGLGAFGSYWDSFLALSLLGWFFCVVRQRWGLWACIAMHAAWVMALRTYKEITVRDIVNPYASVVGDFDNFVGHLASGWMVFALVVLALVEIHRRNQMR